MGIEPVDANWEQMPLADVLDFQEGPGIMARDFRQSGVPLIRLAGLKRRGGLLAGCDFLDADMVSRRWDHFRLQEGDVLLSTSASLGEIATVDQSGAGAIAYTGIIRFRPRGGRMLRDFIPYALVAPSFKLQIEAMGVGSVIRHFGPTHLRQMTVSVPPPEDQQAIAEVLGALEDKIALNERICETCLQLADSCSEAMRRDTGAGPVMTVAQLVSEGHLEFGDGYRTKRAEHGRPGLPILRVAEVADGEIRPAFTDYVRDEFRPAMGGKTSKPGDVVLTTKGTVGRVALIAADHPEFVYSPQVCYFRVTESGGLSNVYLFHWMRGPEFWSQAAGMKGQTDMADYLSLGDIKSLRITLPSQDALAEFNRKCAPLHAQAAAARNENRTLAELRDTLLPQLLSGKLRVKDAVRTVEEVV
jgi:type I restriction enzyme S subunit